MGSVLICVDTCAYKTLGMFTVVISGWGIVGGPHLLVSSHLWFIFV